MNKTIKREKWIEQIVRHQTVLQRLNRKLPLMQMSKQLESQLEELCTVIGRISKLLPVPRIKIIDDGESNQKSSRKQKQEIESVDSDQNSEAGNILNFGQLKQFHYMPLQNEPELSPSKECVLCEQIASKDLGLLLKMKTHMVNPNFVLMHEQCALWSSGLYFFEDEDTGINASKDPVNLYPVVLEAFQKQCFLCKRMGASLKCSQCENQFHFPCFMSKSNYGKVDQLKFTIVCDNEHQNQKKSGGKAAKKTQKEKKVEQKQKKVLKQISSENSCNEEEVFGNAFRQLLNQHPRGEVRLKLTETSPVKEEENLFQELGLNRPAQQIVEGVEQEEEILNRQVSFRKVTLRVQKPKYEYEQKLERTDLLQQ